MKARGDCGAQAARRAGDECDSFLHDFNSV
jgi:hypothetical protein